jgi:hypothetical protein
MTNGVTYPFAKRLATKFLAETRGGSAPKKASISTKQEIKQNFEALVEIAFGSQGINFNSYGIKRMITVYAKEFEPNRYEVLKTRYFL